MEETQRKEQMNKKHRIEFCQVEQIVRDLMAREDNLNRLKESNEEAQARLEAFFLPKIEVCMLASNLKSFLFWPSLFFVCDSNFQTAKSKFLIASQERLVAEKAKAEMTSAMTLEEKKTKICVLERERMKREFDTEYQAMKEASELLNQDLLNYTRQLKVLLGEGAKEFVSVM